jgi:hypothetical protein
MELGMDGKTLTLGSCSLDGLSYSNYTQNLQSTIDLDTVDYYLQQCVFYHAMVMTTKMSEWCTDLIPDYDSSTNNNNPISEPQSWNIRGLSELLCKVNISLE